MGQKWGKPYAHQCHLVPNDDLSHFVNQALQPLLFGVVGLFCVNTPTQLACYISISSSLKYRVPAFRAVKVVHSE